MSRKHAVLAISLWSTVASAFKLSLRYLTPLGLLFYASLTSLILFGVLYAREFSLRRENLRSAYLGLINPLTYYAVLFSAYDLLPAQEAQALNYTWPLMLVLLSIPLLGKRPNPKTISGLFLGFLGAIIVATKGDLTRLSFSDPFGVALGLGSAVIWASYWLLNLRDGRPLIEKMFWNFLFGFAYVSVVLLISGEFIVPPLEGLIGAVYVGLFEMGITFLLWYRAVESDMAFASNLAYLVPFMSLFFISLLVGERIAPATVLGLAMIVGGIILGRGW
ncbi:Permease of the drug/metabolite transporter (DMT) superfamily [Thermococcus sp. 2319x1]|uniref:DMT family transporter n=1 Tax=Thermococcus sp. 2319x1 TaxID=1674923 RepID=UPI00073ADF1D|nr:DMT family transporter [Thermococcus sp. 2319x1]ALV62903.1 Permease of the drug/metabolite transporter (DMT) superfamily [Thermococcus sp. 2319x1]